MISRSLGVWNMFINFTKLHFLNNKLVFELIITLPYFTSEQSFEH